MNDLCDERKIDIIICTDRIRDGLSFYFSVPFLLSNFLLKEMKMVLTLELQITNHVR